MFNSKFGVGVLKHPGYNIGGGVGEGLLLESVLTGAVVGGGISALTGGDFLTGALTGGIGGGIKSFLPDFSKIFMPSGASPVDVATSATSTVPAAMSQAGQAFMQYPTSLLSPGAGIAGNIPAGTYGFTADGLSRAAEAATLTPATAVNPLNQTNIPTPAQTPNVPGATNVSQQIGGANLTGTGSGPAAPPTPPSVAGAKTPDYAKIIQEGNFRPIGISSAPTGTITQTGDYVMNGKVYSGKDLANAGKQSFFDKYKMPILLGGAGLAYNMLNEKPKLSTIQQPNYPKFGLASNYAALPNPTPVYPRFAEGGIAQLAAGGNMGIDKVNVDFMHGDMYPMSQQDRSFYASPTQMPTSAQQTMASYEPKTNPLTGQTTSHMASGGVSDLGNYSDGGRMLRGPGDGMSDSIPGMIAGKRPARLAEGEFVVPADVVSHLGNGSTDAGAKQLYAMMDRVRQARTGNKKQGKQINPRKLMTA